MRQTKKHTINRQSKIEEDIGDVLKGVRIPFAGIKSLRQPPQAFFVDNFPVLAIAFPLRVR